MNFTAGRQNRLPFAAEQQDMLCGLDLEGGGTWLAAAKSGRIAALTNVREPDRFIGNAPSRGLLVSQCVQSTQPLPEYLDSHYAAGGQLQWI